MNAKLAKTVTTIALLITILVATRPVEAQVGTKILTLSNVTSACINVAKQDVDFWILSARVPKDSTFWNTTTGVGASVSTQLQGPSGQSAFPAAASINAQDLDGKIIRASLSLHVINQADLWDTSAGAATKVTSFSTPLTFVRTTGDSAYVKVFQALVSFTSIAGSVVPAVNAMEPAAKLVGQLFSTVKGAFDPNPSDAKNPDFQLGFGLGRQDTGCQDIELHQGVGAMIADYAGNDPGIVKTQHLSDYCFYVHGEEHDPDIVYINRNGTCPAAEPSSANQLNNPQFIWIAYGTCKTDPCRTSTTPPSPGHNLMASLSAVEGLTEALQAKLGVRRQAEVDIAGQALRDQNLDLVGSQSRAASVLRGLALCKSVGISPTRCVDPQFAAP